MSESRALNCKHDWPLLPNNAPERDQLEWRCRKCGELLAFVTNAVIQSNPSALLKHQLLRPD